VIRRSANTLIALFVATMACCLAVPQLAAADNLQILKVDSSHFPEIRIAFVKDDNALQLPDFTIKENGQIVNDVSSYAGKIGQQTDDPHNVIYLTIDASDSMKGAKIAGAQAAALRLLSQAGPSDRFGVVTFGSKAKVALEPTDDLEQVRNAIDKITLSPGTALYDAVKKASGEFPADSTRQVVVLLSDGADVGSKTSQKKAIAAAKNNGVEVYAVGIRGAGFKPEALQNISSKTDGSFESVSSAADLRTVYERLGKELLRGYWLSYHSSQPRDRDVKITIDTENYGSLASSYATPQLTAAELGTLHPSKPKRTQVSAPAVNLPTGPVGMLLAALPFGLILFMFGYRYMSKRSAPQLLSRLEPYERKDPAAAALAASKKQNDDSMLAGLFAFTESLLGKSSLFKRLQFLLEQANLPMREVEMLYIMLTGLAVGSLLGAIFFHGIVGILLSALAGFALPYLWLKRKASKRRKQFEDQLADMLSTVAASLKAGHSFNQAINAVIKEAADPMGHELQRVMTEARLGLSTEAALDTMATRMGSNDFDFAVTTVNIQRTVGGSLSEILEMVSDTVRGRQQFRKKVKALTSMGRMSAYVLIGMPIFMAGVLSLINPTYMEPLLHTPIGHKMIIAGCFFMFLGWFACNRIVSIKT
jgi:tight adherence protein B